MLASRSLLWRAPVAALVLLSGCYCARQPTDHFTALAVSRGPDVVVTTTTSPPPPPPTTIAPHAVAPRAARTGPRLAPAPAPPRPVGWWPDTAFWQRLSYGCESSSGDNGNGGGFFQFSPGTAKAVGYHYGMTWDQQRALADVWLARIGGPARGGTSSGWPVCWWHALRG